MHDCLGGRSLGTSDAAALGTLGIDLDAVRRRVEDSFGPGALQPARPLLPRRTRWFRRRDCTVSVGVPAGHLPFTARAKRVLERSLHEAQAHGDHEIGLDHLVLGLLDPAGNLAVEILGRLQVTPDAVRAAVLTSRGRAA